MMLTPSPQELPLTRPTLAPQLSTVRYSRSYHTAVALQKLLLAEADKPDQPIDTLLRITREWQSLEALKQTYRKRKLERQAEREAGQDPVTKRSVIPEGVEP